MTKTAQFQWALLSGPMVVDCAAARTRWPPPSVCFFRNARGDIVDDAEEKARLISAAPNLLAACQSALDVLENMTTHEFQTGADKHVRDTLAAAIARAEGRERSGQ